MTDDIARMELATDLEAALARLPDEQRIPLLLTDVEGYRVDEVATLLQVPSGTIKSRCARARAKLAETLRDAGNHGMSGTVPLKEPPTRTPASPDRSDNRGGTR